MQYLFDETGRRYLDVSVAGHWLLSSSVCMDSDVSFSVAAQTQGSREQIVHLPCPILIEVCTQDWDSNSFNLNLVVAHPALIVVLALNVCNGLAGSDLLLSTMLAT